jgi:hypothetical protein
MSLESLVILPDGRIDHVPSSLVPDDVELVPLRADHRIEQAVEDGIKTPAQLDHYLTCRDNGCSRSMALMLATRSFPGIRTDSIFNEGRFSGQDQFIDCPAKGAWLRRQAEEAGVSTTGKYYLSGLAEYPGDPTAWVDSMSDVRRVAREKNLAIREGYLTQKAVEREPMADVEIADDIIDNEVADILDENPGANPDEVRAQVYSLRTGRVDANPLCVNDEGVGDSPE